MLLQCRQLCAEVGLSVISCGADGASSEQGAHNLVNASHEAKDYIHFSLDKYGIKLSIPIFPGSGPLVTLPDPAHVQKVLRDNEQSGTHLLTLEGEYLVHRTLVDLRDQPGSGMVKKDVINTDKQDNGAAIRLYHSKALQACLRTDSNAVDPRFRGAFVIHFVFGELLRLSCLVS